ncbi:MAG: hypothetical protein LBG57_05715 [Treponema sp.]|jgi:hypothetical protein|nr:hypothetical protein [Treponema sp.]
MKKHARILLWRPKIIRFPIFFAAGIFTLVLLGAGLVFAQNSQMEGDDDSGLSRGSIPEVLLRPQRGEAPRYPDDTVIGPLGQGEAPREGYLFARQVASALAAGNMSSPSLAAMNRASLESLLSVLNDISPRTYRIGGGREEADGAVSFLVRFAGREQGITGELYIRLQEQAPAAVPAETGDSSEAAEETPPAAEAARPGRVWVFEDLLLDEPRSRQSEDAETRHRFDFSPYERFF